MQDLTEPPFALNGQFWPGLGIAFVAALRAKVPVLLHDRSEPQIKKGLALLDKLLEKDVAKVGSPMTAERGYNNLRIG